MQAYPKYGSEKKGPPTTYYLTIADTQIFTLLRELEQVDLVGINDPTALLSPGPLKGLVAGGRHLHAVATRRPARGLEADSRA